MDVRNVWIVLYEVQNLKGHQALHTKINCNLIELYHIQLQFLDQTYHLHQQQADLQDLIFLKQLQSFYNLLIEKLPLFSF